MLTIELENYILNTKATIFSSNKRPVDSAVPNMLTAYKLKIKYNLKNKEIAEEMGLSIGYIRSLLHRAPGMILFNKNLKKAEEAWNKK